MTEKMKNTVQLIITGVVFTFLSAGALLKLPYRLDQSNAGVGLSNVRKAQKLQTAYNNWVARYEQNGGDRYLVLALGWSKGLSVEFTEARGTATFDLIEKSVSIEVHGLEDNVSDVWLVDNRTGPGYSVMPESGDAMVYLGSIHDEDGSARLQVELDRDAFANFYLDLVVISRAGEAPGAGGILFGTPMLFQRLYRSVQAGQAGIPIYPDGSAERPVLNAGPGFRLFEPTGESGTFDLAGLIEEGEEIFFGEWFEGNGRTCGTCHPQENNLTLDPEFIATLPSQDALFIAENNATLNSDLNGGYVFENPVLMREAGLIVMNPDGFDDLKNKFVMRGVPHTLALNFTLNPSAEDGTTQPPNQRTGWSGDGAPNGGTLRDFAIGAIKQHLTKSLFRTPGRDFRLPTDFELDALEAFMLTLGRQEELDIPSMAFQDADVTSGQELFQGDAKCNICHVNAGANFIDAPDENRNFNTGVENFPSPHASLGEPLPRDGGFAQTPDGDGQGGFGNGTFNTPSIIEAGDTAPNFHNNITEDLEASVNFYNSTEFNDSPGGELVGGINMTEQESFQVTAFLYVLNVLENIRSSRELLETAKSTTDRVEMDDYLEIAVAETGDAVESMQGSSVQAEVVVVLEEAESHTIAAHDNQFRDAKIREIDEALADLDEAEDLLLIDEGNMVKQAAKGESLPTNYALLQNHPNPFNPATEIRFQLPEASHVVVRVFNTLGQEVRKLVDRRYEAGLHTIRWDGKTDAGIPMPSSMYLYQLQAADFTQVKKMTLLR